MFHLSIQRPEQFQEYEAQRINVHFVIIRFAFDLLGAHVQLGADLIRVLPGMEQHVAVNCAGKISFVTRRSDVVARLFRHGRNQPEIANFDGSVRSEEDIRWFQVTMDQTL